MPNNTGLNFCRRCGNSLAGRTRFCGHCGTLITSTALPAASLASPQSFWASAKLKYGINAVMGMGALLACGYLYWHLPPRLDGWPPGPAGYAMHSSESPFLHPDPPADLITTLQRSAEPKPPFFDPVGGLDPTVFKDLCHIIAIDYPATSYVYGSTGNDTARQAQVQREGQELLDEVSALFSDKTTARHQAQQALGLAADMLYAKRDLNPGHICDMFKARMPGLF